MPSADAARNWLRIDPVRQRLELLNDGRALGAWPVSTGAHGLGERMNSGQTPRGWHRIRAKIGAGLPRGAVLVGRRWTGEIHTPALHQAAPERDWIDRKSVV